jgi:hypothetical protein
MAQGRMATQDREKSQTPNVPPSLFELWRTRQIPKKFQIAVGRDEGTTSRGIASKLKILNSKYFLAFEYWRL